MILQRISLFIPGGGSLRPFVASFRGAKVGKNIWISQMVYIDELHPEALTIGDNVTIGLRTSIFTHFYWGGKREATNMGSVVIEKDVFIGPHCVILPGVHIGEGAVVMAGTVVSRNVPPHTLWGPPSAGPLGEVTVSLTARHSYQEFVQGLRPKRKKISGDAAE